MRYLKQDMFFFPLFQLNGEKSITYRFWVFFRLKKEHKGETSLTFKPPSGQNIQCVYLTIIAVPQWGT